MRVHLIEAQELFVSTLVDVFADAGLQLQSVSKDADFRQLLDEQPDVVFIDVDFTEQEPLHLIRLIHTLLPQAFICVYAGHRTAEWAKACHFSGANAVFSKHADREEIVAGLHDMFETRHFTDVRLRDNTE